MDMYDTRSLFRPYLAFISQWHTVSKGSDDFLFTVVFSRQDLKPTYLGRTLIENMTGSDMSMERLHWTYEVKLHSEDFTLLHQSPIFSGFYNDLPSFVSAWKIHIEAITGQPLRHV
jgi:hypothetical protein